MNATPAELMKEFVNNQKFSSTTEVMQAMKEMFRDVLQQVMEGELDETLGYEKSDRLSDNDETTVSKNYRNGYSKKTVKTQLGEVDVKIPRDRNGEYEPKIIGKYNRNADGMEEKILALYACGMSQRDISEQIKHLYDVEISPELVSKISEKIMPEVAAWQTCFCQAENPPPIIIEKSPT
jgi:putative transposase